MANWYRVYQKELSFFEVLSVKVSNGIFTVPSVIFHTTWFVLWFLAHLNINLLTLIVSLEAIYITLFIGIGQGRAEKRARLKAEHEGETGESTERGSSTGAR